MYRLVALLLGQPLHHVVHVSRRVGANLARFLPEEPRLLCLLGCLLL
jgi:hypothetical protein